MTSSWRCPWLFTYKWAHLVFLYTLRAYHHKPRIFSTDLLPSTTNAYRIRFELRIRWSDIWLPTSWFGVIRVKDMKDTSWSISWSSVRVQEWARSLKKGIGSRSSNHKKESNHRWGSFWSFKIVRNEIVNKISFQWTDMINPVLLVKFGMTLYPPNSTQTSSSTLLHFLRYLFHLGKVGKVITKSKVGSLTMQPAKHDVTGMPLYRMYPYPICSSTLWLAIHPLGLLVNTISKIILESFEKFC